MNSTSAIRNLVILSAITISGLYFLSNKKNESVELPNSVVREITYTEPAVKGDTTSGKVMKPAKIATDFELMVPLFCDTGDKIEIDTRTLEYKNRVK